MLIEVEVVAADNGAAKAMIKGSTNRYGRFSDAGLCRAEFSDLARKSVNPASPPYGVVEFAKGRERC